MTNKSHATATTMGPTDILAAVYSDKDFMEGVREAASEIEDGSKGTHFRDLKRKKNA